MGEREQGASSRERARSYRERAPRAPDGPVDVDALLPGTGEVEIDVGFGRGQSLLARAAAAPGSRILGIERKSKWAALVAERCAREGLDRVRVVCEDARTLLTRLGPPASVARIFVSFPDPWWKKRHGKRRLVDRPFLDLVARLLAPGGELMVQTDVEERAGAYRELLRAHPDLRLTPDAFIDDNPFDNPSNRERRAARDGLPVYRLLARRR